jgi:hypothetical protein
MTPAKIEELADTGFMEAAFLYRQMTHGRLAGVKEDPLLDLLLSRVKGVGNERIKASMGSGDSKSFFLPYIMRLQEDVVNANAFKIIAGSAGTGHSGSWKIVVTNSGWNVAGTSPVPAYISNLQKIHRYFLEREGVVLLHSNGATDAVAPMMKVANSIDTTSNPAHGGAGTPSAEVTLIPYYTDAGFAADIATVPALLSIYQPEEGVVMCGTNTVSDYESWCHNQPVDMSKRIKIYWNQTSRFTRCWDDEYEKFLGYIFEGKVNPYIEKFKELPMAEQNKKMQAQYQKKVRNTMFYGVPINEFQTEERYRDLPQINDPRTGHFLEYQAQSKGIRTQIGECGRVLDLGGAALNFNALEEMLYQLKRHREVDGGTVEEIDVMTDRGTANRLKGLMSRYYQAKYGTMARSHFGPSDPIRFEDQILWHRQSYDFDASHVRLNVLVENSMSDHKIYFQGAGAPNPARGNNMWFLDWSDIQVGVSEVNSRRSHTPDLESDPDFKCIIKANITHYEMESMTFAPIVQDETRHLVLENFSDDCPDYEVEACPVVTVPAP